MSYAVHWPQEAIDRLAAEYLAARLAGRGDEFRPRGSRIGYDLPASVRFRVEAAAKRVVILDVVFHP